MLETKTEELAPNHAIIRASNIKDKNIIHKAHQKTYKERQTTSRNPS
jgi:hypothetical protein